MRRVLIPLSSTITLVVLLGAASPSIAAAQDRRVEIQRVVRTVVDAAVAVEVAATVQAAAAGQRRETRYPFQREERISRTVALGPAGSLDLRNLSGRITMTGGSGRDVTLDILRVSRGRTEEDAARGLTDVPTEISHQGTRATVETRYPTQDRERLQSSLNVSVTYDITAPAGTSVTINNLSGDVQIKNITGDIAVDVKSGHVSIAQASRISKVSVLSGDVTLTDVKGTAPIDAGTISGNVQAHRVQAPRLSLSTVSGNLTASDVTVDQATLTTTSGTIGFTGALARGGRYELQSHSGDVTLTVVGNAGFELTARTFSGRVQPDAALGLKTRAADRREVRGTVGDGGATVQATTFSGDVTIVRK